MYRLMFFKTNFSIKSPQHAVNICSVFLEPLLILPHCKNFDTYLEKLMLIFSTAKLPERWETMNSSSFLVTPGLIPSLRQKRKRRTCCNLCIDHYKTFHIFRCIHRALCVNHSLPKQNIFQGSRQTRRVAPKNRF